MAYIGKRPTDVPLEAGDLTATTITGQSAETAIADDDLILISDTSASSALRKMTKANFVSGVGGLEVADQWRITSNEAMTSTGGFFTSNWERVDTSGQGVVGSMSQSSGVFTFPSTGIYWVSFNGMLYTGTTATGSVKLGCEIHVTTNDSSYTLIASAYDWNPSNQFTFKQISAVNTMIDVTDTSNVKVKFKNLNGGSNNSDREWVGNTSENKTFATFMKMGAT